jgi:hypothetical protein
LTLLWLPFLAFVRRLLIAEAGWTSNDPLILVGPIVVLFLLYRLFVIEKRELAPDLLSKLVLAMLALLLFGAFNPVGAGGPLAGLGGLLFVGVPLLWFFIGRELADRRMLTGLMYAVVVVGVGIGVYGLYQTQLGHLPQWDVDWYEITGFPGVKAGTSDTGDTLFRPWGTFPSTAEYSEYLGIALVIGLAMLYHRRPAIAIGVPLLAVAVFLAGGRGGMALVGLAVVVMTALRTRNRVLAFMVVVLGIGTIYGAALAFGPRLDRAANLSSDPKVGRQVGGLLNPLDPNKSTFLGHWDAVTTGVKAGFRNPVGEGTGSTNIGGRLGGAASSRTEFDIADVFVSVGLIGGFVFVAIVVLTFRTVFTRYLTRRPVDRLMFAAAGILVVSFGQWLNGGHYAASALTWFVLGWTVRPSRRDRPGERRERSTATEPWRPWLPWRRSTRRRQPTGAGGTSRPSHRSSHARSRHRDHGRRSRR